MPDDDDDPFGFNEDAEEEYDPGEDCGRWMNGRLSGSCRQAGTEFCDFMCPYRSSL